MKRLSLALAFVIVSAPGAAAAAASLDMNSLLPAGSSLASGKIVQALAALTILSVAPGLLIMATSFTRFAIALSFLRSGLGLQTTPANLVLISLALFMTFCVMRPAFDKAWTEGVKPLSENRLTEMEAFEKISAPFAEFMLANVRDKDLKLFEDLRKEPVADKNKTPSLATLAPAFMISELRRGFEIGFLIVVPFLVIDLVVAIVVMAMGMMMMPPSTISLPIKILFFVLIDGWHLLVGNLVRSFS